LAEDLAHLLPEELMRRPHGLTRFFYYDQKLARITCMIRHVSPRSEPGVEELVYPANGEVPPEHHDRRIYAITYVLAGRARLRYEDARAAQEVVGGDLFQITNQNQPHDFLIFEDGFTEVSFCLDAVTGNHLAELGIWDTRTRVRRVGARPELVRAYLGFWHFLRDRGASNLALLQECIRLIELVHKQEDLRERDGEFRERAVALLSRDLKPSVSLTHVARLMGMSYDSFRQRFRKLMGLSPVRYRLLQRLEKAKQLLESHSVKETAAALGYTDPSVFSRQFKKWIKSPPKEQRRGRAQR
jgi:AraC-like DNA-binding protein